MSREIIGSRELDLMTREIPEDCDCEHWSEHASEGFFAV